MHVTTQIGQAYLGHVPMQCLLLQLWAVQCWLFSEHTRPTWGMSPWSAMAPQFSESEAVSSLASFLVSVNTMERPAQPWDLIMSATMVLRCVQWQGSTRCFTLVEAYTEVELGYLGCGKLGFPEPLSETTSGFSMS